MPDGGHRTWRQAPALVKWSWRPFWGCRRCDKSRPVAATGGSGRFTMDTDWENTKSIHLPDDCGARPHVAWCYLLYAGRCVSVDLLHDPKSTNTRMERRSRGYPLASLVLRDCLSWLDAVLHFRTLGRLLSRTTRAPWRRMMVAPGRRAIASRHTAWANM